MVNECITMPNMDLTVKMTVTVPGSLRVALEKQAEVEGRTLSNMVTVLLKEAIKKATQT